MTHEDSPDSSPPPGSGPDNLSEPTTADGRAPEEFMNMLSRGAEFMKELVNDNQRLRLRVTSLEEQLRNTHQPTDNDTQYKQLLSELESWKEKYNALLNRIGEVEDENKDFLQRYMEVEEENNNLANLYIASYQLHSTLNFNEVLQIILEIVINLIGAEVFAVYLLDQETNELGAVASEGMEISEFPTVALGQGEIGEAVENAKLTLIEDRLASRELKLESPVAVIPLQIKDDTIGAIVVFQLLQQKSKFMDVDRELFHLLAGHAATAVFASRLYTDSERKLSTMQGAIDLLTK